ncbi:MAG: 16S rRNA (cytidine(1402)-2'-O)-methyltransferase [Chloroflexota bacterium]
MTAAGSQAGEGTGEAAGASAPGAGSGATAGSGGTLYVVATPIGNLGDITLRALEVLRAVPLIAAEDTRHTRRLLERHAVDTRTTSYHAQSEASRTTALLEHLRSGADLALVTDAGTPAVSDPGADLVAAWAGRGGTVVAIPGASAVLAAVVSSGVAGPRWSFEGFLPRSGRERGERLRRIADDDRGTLVFEAPGRVAATLRDLAAVCGGERPAAVCRELTKLHETIVRGTLAELAASAESGRIPARGEFVLVVGAWPEGRPVSIEDEADALAAARAEVERLVATGVARGEAAKRVAALSGLARRQLYGADRVR